MMWIDKWPIHTTIFVQRGEREDREDEADVDVEMEPTIRIQRARLTSCPDRALWSGAGKEPRYLGIIPSRTVVHLGRFRFIQAVPHVFMRRPFGGRAASEYLRSVFL